MSDDSDIELLLEVIKSRQKFPRACIEGYDTIKKSDPNSTERIFLENGGISAWLAYAVTRRAAESTAHATGKAKRQRLIERIEAQSANIRRELATKVATAIQPERDRIESIVRIARQQSDRARRSRQPTEPDNDRNERQNEKTRETSPTDTTSESYSADDQQSGVARAAEPPKERFESNQLLAYASLTECTRLFPPYMAASIERKADLRDAQRLVAAASITSEGILRLKLANNKVEHIAKELFRAHVETGDGKRHVYLHGIARAVPCPNLILKGCRSDAIRDLLGDKIADAVFATNLYVEELKDGCGASTDCVSLTVPLETRDSAELCILLPSQVAGALKSKLEN